ncbi:hypothetical protein B0H13DRAFT_2123253, partial [Mycena leptocephala]
RARLGSPLSISRAGIPCVVWAEDAPAIVHHVPIGLVDLQILVPDSQVADAANVICAKLPYVTLNGDVPDSHWHDYEMNNPDFPHAFILTPKDTLVLQHSNSNPAWEEAFAAIWFPTVAALLDALGDTQHEPPILFHHMRFRHHLLTCMEYLQFTEDDTNERVLIPQYLQVLDQQLPFEDSVMERRSLKAARFERLGLQYQPPATIPYNILQRRRGIPPDTGEPRLTPYLTRGNCGQLSVQWRALPKYASIAARMLR